jgi:hypothetical protein
MNSITHNPDRGLKGKKEKGSAKEYLQKEAQKGKMC